MCYDDWPLTQSVRSPSVREGRERGREERRGHACQPCGQSGALLASTANERLACAPDPQARTVVPRVIAKREKSLKERKVDKFQEMATLLWYSHTGLN